MLCTQIFLFSFDIQNNFGTQHVLQLLRSSEKDLPVPHVLLMFTLQLVQLKNNETVWLQNVLLKSIYVLQDKIHLLEMFLSFVFYYDPGKKIERSEIQIIYFQNQSIYYICWYLLKDSIGTGKKIYFLNFLIRTDCYFQFYQKSKPVKIMKVSTQMSLVSHST